MSRKTLSIIGGALVVLVLAILVVWGVRSHAPAAPANNSSSTAPTAGNTPANSATYNASVPDNVAVPMPTSTNVPKNVAKPITVAPSGSSADTPLMLNFDITVKGGQFVPNTIIAKANQTLRINFTAADGSYDFVQPDLGLKLVIPQGSTKLAMFQVLSPGQFTYYCESCGGPSKGPVGKIIVSK